MSRPHGRPSRKNAVDRSDAEEISSVASDNINAVLQGARTLTSSPVINGDYTLPGVVSQRGAIPRDTERRRTLQEELDAVLREPENMERIGNAPDTSLRNKYDELKREYDNIRRENRELNNRLEASERRIDALANRFQDQLEELENKMHAETSEQIRSLRNLHEVRYQILEGRLRDQMDQDLQPSEADIRRNTQDIRRISQRQQNLEDRFRELGLPHPEEQVSPGSLRITPKTPTFDGKCSPVKFLEELKDF